MHFGENQLSRSLISLSPLPTVHPPSFQPRWVRSSTASYHCFNLTMGRSLRFGSRTRDHKRLISDSLSLRLPHNGLTKPHATNSQAHSSKGTPSPLLHQKVTQALTAYRHPVSGTISLPSRGTFHHSLTVLIHYRSSRSIQAYQVVLADSRRISRAPRYLGTAPNNMDMPTIYTTITLSGQPSQTVQLNTPHHHASQRRDDKGTAPQHRMCNPR